MTVLEFILPALLVILLSLPLIKVFKGNVKMCIRDRFYIVVILMNKLLMM